MISQSDKRPRDNSPEPTEDTLEHRAKVNKTADMSNMEERLAQLIQKNNFDIKTLNDNLGTAIAKLSEKVIQLEKQCNTQEERLNDIEQANLSASFTITGLPPTKEESPLAVANRVLAKIEGSLETSDIKRISLIQHKSGDGSMLIINLWNDKKKYELIAKFRQALKDKRPIITEAIFNLPLESPRKGKQIRLNNLLTRSNSTLFKQARALIGKPFQFVWEYDGKILVRFKEGSNAIRIKSLFQLNDLATLKAM